VGSRGAIGRLGTPQLPTPATASGVGSPPTAIAAEAERRSRETQPDDLRTRLEERLRKSGS